MEKLNHSFTNASVGVKLYSYHETRETELEVLVTGDTKGGSLAPVRLREVRLRVVDDHSATLSTPDLVSEDESVIKLKTTHTGAPNLIDQDGIDNFIDTIDKLIQNFSVEECLAYQSLNSSIMKDVLVDIHQFYQTREPTSMKFWSVKPPLKDFFQEGPTKCLEDNIIASKPNNKVSTNTVKSDPQNPAIQIEHAAPSINIAFVDSENATPPVQKPMPSLFNPESEQFKSIHMRTPPLDNNTLGLRPLSHLGPPKTEKDQANSVREPVSDAIQEGAPQRPPTYQIPTSSSDLFKWIHIPFTHSGWVPVCHDMEKLNSSPTHNFTSVFSLPSPKKRPIWTYIQNLWRIKFGNHSIIYQGILSLMLGLCGQL